MRNTKIIDALRDRLSSKGSESGYVPLKSTQNWSLDLLEITLHPSFGSFISQILGKNENIHFISIAWDLNKLKDAADNNLNFIGNGISLELFPGQSHDFGKRGLSLFPENKVVDSLNVSIIVFKCKCLNQQLHAKMHEIESMVKSSLLIQELTDIPKNFSIENKEYLQFLANKLILNLESFISFERTKHITTFNFNYSVKEELDFYGTHRFLQNGIRIRLKKNKN